MNTQEITWLKEQGITLISESPLEIQNHKYNYIGLPAELLVNEIFSYKRKYLSIDISTITNDKKYLLEFSDNYGDEFDMNEFTTMDGVSVIRMINSLSTYQKNIEIYFGTNESFTYNDGKDLLNTIRIKEISETEYNVLQNLFGGSYNSNIFNYIEEKFYEDEDSSDEEDYISIELKRQEKIKNLKDSLFLKGWSIENTNNPYLFKYLNSNGDLGYGSVDFGNKILLKLNQN